MSLNSLFDIAGSGMSAQNIRMNTTASNLANAETASSSVDSVYRARKPIFAAVQEAELSRQANGFLAETPESMGVKVEGIVESDAELEMRYQPEHPLANDDGYVYYPNVNVIEEMADMISASRSFQTNVDMMETAKSMLQRVLTLGQ